MWRRTEGDVSEQVNVNVNFQCRPASTAEPAVVVVGVDAAAVGGCYGKKGRIV